MSTAASRKTLWLGLLLGLSVLVNAGFIGGFIYHRHYLLPPPEHMQKIQQRLQLTQAQQQVLARLQADVRHEVRENLQVTRERHHELVEQLQQEPLDLPALEKNLWATTEPQVAMQRDVILRLLAFRATLTPAQKQIFNEKMERPGFLLHLAGFPGPFWQPPHCRGKSERRDDVKRLPESDSDSDAPARP